MPVPDLGALGSPAGDLSGPAAGDQARASIWPHVEARIVDLAAAHRSTPVSYTHLRAPETVLDIVCRLLLETTKHDST